MNKLEAEKMLIGIIDKLKLTKDERTILCQAVEALKDVKKKPVDN